MLHKKIKVLREVLGDHYKTNSEYLFFCPACDHHKRKLSLNLEKDKFKCWVCDYRGNSIQRVVRRFGTFPQRKEWEKLTGKIDLNHFDEILKALNGFEERQEEPTMDLPKEFLTLCKPPDSSVYNAPLNYLRKRGLTKNDILRWKIGFCPSGEFENRIIIPSFNNKGKVNYFIARSYCNDWKKYLNPQSSKDVIFNELYIDWDSDLVIVEGVFDAIKAGNAVPILGSTLRDDSRLFQKIVKHDTPVYIALDPDAEKKSLQLIKKLLQYDVEVYKVDIAPYSDVGEMTIEEFQKRKKEATFLTTDKYVTYQVRGVV
jgi:DNA primase